MKRLPFLPTLIVAAAVATMIWLGVWQLQRARWKDGLLMQYRAAAGQPPVSAMPLSVQPERLAFRRMLLRCAPARDVVQIGGRDRRGVTGYRQISACRLTDGRRLMLDRGLLPPGQQLGQVAGADYATFAGYGRLIPDDVLARRVGGVDIPLLLVAEAPPALEPSVPPSIVDIPNNHRAYAVQWFLFAGVAFIVYLLALRRRRG